MVQTSTGSPLLVSERSSQSGQQQVFAAQRTRAQAVLEGLLKARETCEEHGSRMNRSDLYKTVTGRSALDAAITATQRMIENLDRSLGKASIEVEVRAAGLMSRDRAAAR